MQEGRLPKPDWNQFNSGGGGQPRPRPSRPPTQKRPTVFSSYYTKREANGGQNPHPFGPGQSNRFESRPQSPSPFNASQPRQRYPYPQRTTERRSQGPDSSMSMLRPAFQHRGGGRSRPFRRSVSGRGRGGHRHSHSNRKHGPGCADSIKKLKKTEGIAGCCECEQSMASYRCPRCLQKYCSVSCYKTHKDGINCIVEEYEEGESRGNEDNFKVNELHKRQPEPRGRVEYLYPTGDTIKPEGLEKLTQEPLKSKIVHLLRSQRLRDKVRSLDNSSDPRGLISSFTEDKEFSEFRTFMIENLSNDLFR